MTDEIALHRDMDRAAKAQALLADPLLNEGLDTFEAEMLQAWRATRQDDAASRERIWALVKAAGIVRTHLGRIMENGKVSAAMLNDMLGRSST